MTTATFDPREIIPPMETQLVIDNRKRKSGNSYDFNISNTGYNTQLHRMRLTRIDGLVHIPNVNQYNNRLNFTRTTGPGAPISSFIQLSPGFYPTSDTFTDAIVAALNVADPLGLYTRSGNWNTVYDQFKIKAGDAWLWQITGGSMTEYPNFFYIPLNFSANIQTFYDAALIYTHNLYVYCDDMSRTFVQGNDEADGNSQWIASIRLGTPSYKTYFSYFEGSSLLESTFKMYYTLQFQSLTFSIRDDYGRRIQFLITTENQNHLNNDLLRFTFMVQTKPEDK